MHWKCAGVLLFCCNNSNKSPQEQTTWPLRNAWFQPKKNHSKWIFLGSSRTQFLHLYEKYVFSKWCLTWYGQILGFQNPGNLKESLITQQAIHSSLILHWFPTKYGGQFLRQNVERGLIATAGPSNRTSWLSLLHFPSRRRSQLTCFTDSCRCWLKHVSLRFKFIIMW